MLTRKEFEEIKPKILMGSFIYPNGWWILEEFKEISPIVRTVSKIIENIYLCNICNRVWAPPVIQSNGDEEYFSSIPLYGKKKRVCNECKKKEYLK